MRYACACAGQRATFTVGQPNGGQANRTHKPEVEMQNKFPIVGRYTWPLTDEEANAQMLDAGPNGEPPRANSSPLGHWIMEGTVYRVQYHELDWAVEVDATGLQIWYQDDPSPWTIALPSFAMAVALADYLLAPHAAEGDALLGPGVSMAAGARALGMLPMPVIREIAYCAEWRYVGADGSEYLPPQWRKAGPVDQDAFCRNCGCPNCRTRDAELVGLITRPDGRARQAEAYDEWMEAHNEEEEEREVLLPVARRIVQEHGREDTVRVLLADHTQWPAPVIARVAHMLEQEGIGRHNL